MNFADGTLILLYFSCLLAVTPVMGAWLAGALRSNPPFWLRWLRPCERCVYRLAGVAPDAEMNWRDYAAALLVFNLLGGAAVFVLQLAQGWLPLNPQHCSGVAAPLALNTAVSFMTNTNWQAYSGEASLSYLTQMLGLGVQNFLSAATGIAVMAALARGFARKNAATLGNFWADLVRSTLYVLLPLSLVFALVLTAQGVVMSFAPYAQAQTLSGETQTIPLGPAASQVAIKQLGTNGGGFFGANSAHPFENPTPLSNFLQMLAILLIPAGCVDAYGRLTGARKHAFCLLGVMVFLLAGAFGISLYAQLHPPSALGNAAEVIATEGTEARLGVVGSVLWANATTAASSGSINAAHGSLAPIAGGMAIFNMLLGEVVFGGVGSGLYGMVMVAVVTVFLAGLMVGRTPEYLGKKINAREVRLSVAAVMAPCLVVLAGCAVSFMTQAGAQACGSQGPHALSEILYAWASMANNNGSAFGSLTATGPLYTIGGALAMFVGRFVPIACVLAFAGGVAAKKTVPPSPGTFPTDGLLFAGVLCGVLLTVVGLTFFPALALGPVLEHLLLSGGRTF